MFLSAIVVCRIIFLSCFFSVEGTRVSEFSLNNIMDKHEFSEPYYQGVIYRAHNVTKVRDHTVVLASQHTVEIEDQLRAEHELNSYAQERTILMKLDYFCGETIRDGKRLLRMRTGRGLTLDEILQVTPYEKSKVIKQLQTAARTSLRKLHEQGIIHGNIQRSTLRFISNTRADKGPLVLRKASFIDYTRAKDMDCSISTCQEEWQKAMFMKEVSDMDILFFQARRDYSQNGALGNEHHIATSSAVKDEGTENRKSSKKGTTRRQLNRQDPKAHEQVLSLPKVTLPKSATQELNLEPSQPRNPKKRPSRTEDQQSPEARTRNKNPFPRPKAATLASPKLTGTETLGAVAYENPVYLFYPVTDEHDHAFIKVCKYGKDEEEDQRRLHGMSPLSDELAVLKLLHWHIDTQMIDGKTVIKYYDFRGERLDQLNYGQGTKAVNFNWRTVQEAAFKELEYFQHIGLVVRNVNMNTLRIKTKVWKCGRSHKFGYFIDYSFARLLNCEKSSCGDPKIKNQFEKDWQDLEQVLTECQASADFKPFAKRCPVDSRLPKMKKQKVDPEVQHQETISVDEYQNDEDDPIVSTLNALDKQISEQPQPEALFPLESLELLHNVDVVTEFSELPLDDIDPDFEMLLHALAEPNE